MENYAYKYYKFCPICGYEYTAEDFDLVNTSFHCKKCGYVFYQNQIAVTSIIIPSLEDKMKVLLTQRKLNPKKGKYDTPGGFPKYEEELIDTIIREIREEIGLSIKIEKILDVRKNDYKFEGITYKHAVVYFLAKPISERLMTEANLDRKEIMDARFFDLRDLNNFISKLGFPSDQVILRKYLEEIE